MSLLFVIIYLYIYYYSAFIKSSCRNKHSMTTTLTTTKVNFMFISKSLYKLTVVVLLLSSFWDSSYKEDNPCLGYSMVVAERTRARDKPPDEF